MTIRTLYCLLLVAVMAISAFAGNEELSSAAESQELSIITPDSLTQYGWLTLSDTDRAGLLVLLAEL